jgi:hypothetical protein
MFLYLSRLYHFKMPGGTSYGMYIMVQNELTAAYNELRDELAMERFGNVMISSIPKNRLQSARSIQ